MEEIKSTILKLKFDVSKAKNIYAKIWIEGKDINIENDGIMVMDGLELLFAKQEAMPITLLKDHKGYYKVKVSPQFTEFFNGTSQQSTLYRNAFSNFKKSLLTIKFGDTIEITEAEVKEISKDYLKDELFVKDCVIENLQNSKSDYAKRIISEMGLKKASQTINVDEVIGQMAGRIMRNVLSNSKIIHSDEI